MKLYMTNERDNVYSATKFLREVLAQEDYPPIDMVLKGGFTPILVQLLGVNDKDILVEASWCITNIVFGSSAKEVVELGVIDPLVNMLSHPSSEVKEQATWVIGNIAGDGISYRDSLLSKNVIALMLNNLKTTYDSIIDSSFIKTSIWSFSNIFRGKPSPKKKYIDLILPHLSSYVYSDNNDIIVDVLWTLSYISDGDNSQIQSVLDLGIIDRIVDLLSKSSDIQIPALRVIGNIASGSEQQTQTLINSGPLKLLRETINSSKKTRS